MPIYKNEERGTYYASFYYTDWKGEKKRKKKEGFKTKREAKQFEHDFLEHVSPNPDMTFQALYDLYMKDCQTRIKISTLTIKETYFRMHILPYFGQMKLTEITPAKIREWQNNLLSSGSLKATTINLIGQQLSTALNYAVKFYGLSKNPYALVGRIRGAKHADMKIWTPEQFQRFLSCIPAESHELRTAYELLFWTGIRVGELLALTVGDVDMENKKISITKTLMLIHGQVVIGTPKTSKSVRVVDLPSFLVDDLKEYLSTLFRPSKSTRIFHWNEQSQLKQNLIRAASRADLEPIRIHDFRHSHASFLIAQHCPITYVSKRLGHENSSVTMSIYAHFYEGTDRQAVNIMEQYVFSTFGPSSAKEMAELQGST